MKALTAAEMREVDRLTTERYGISSYQLMETAGTLAANAFAKLMRDAGLEAAHLFVSSRATFLRSTCQLHKLANPDFISAMHERYRGIPDEILADKDLVELLRRVMPRVGIVLLSGPFKPLTIERALAAGVSGFVDLTEFLSRPLYAHLAHSSEQGPRESPVWFLWDGAAIWIIGGTSFPTNLKQDPRCALGIVDWDPPTGRSHHVGIRGRAVVLPFDREMAKAIFRRYFGPDESTWDRRFDDVFTGELRLEMVRIVPETVVMRDQSYERIAYSADLRR